MDSSLRIVLTADSTVHRQHDLSIMRFRAMDVGCTGVAVIVRGHICLLLGSFLHITGGGLFARLTCRTLLLVAGLR